MEHKPRWNVIASGFDIKNKDMFFIDALKLSPSSDQ